MANSKKHKKYVLHKENCQSKLRRTFIKKNGEVISLFGRHGFEWSITKESPFSSSTNMSITTFPNREMALKEYRKLTM